MTNRIRILTASIAMLLATAASAQQVPHRDPARIPGSRVRQLLLKQALEKEADGTLVATLTQYKRIYKAMGPEQLGELRKKAYMIRRLPPAEQANLFRSAEKLLHLSPEHRQAYRQRAEWLDRVVKSLTREQIEELKAMTPEQRGRRLLELKAKILATQPTSAPASAPTTRPSVTDQAD